MKFLDIYNSTTPLYRLKKEGRVVLKLTGGVSILKRGYNAPLLILQTTESLDIGKGGLLVILVGYGSKLLDTNNLKATPLIMMGLTSVASKLLIDELKTLLNKK